MLASTQALKSTERKMVTGTKIQRIKAVTKVTVRERISTASNQSTNRSYKYVNYAEVLGL